MKPFDECNVFEKVAEWTIPGDEITLPGGQVSYRVREVRTGPEWQGVRADRTETHRDGGSSTSTQDISSNAWHDLVRYASTARRRP